MMTNSFLSILRLPLRYHFFGSFAIVLTVLAVMAVRLADRQNFATSELYQEVTQRWGTPIEQPVPSVRYVESGTVFNRLESLPLAGQKVRVDAAMNYRKRGLVYFSGFDFRFDGAYRLRNDRGKTLDLVFVFPLSMIRDQVLLSDLRFEVGGEAQPVELADGRDRLRWTGRLQEGEEIEIDIAFRGRGLDSFVYRLDPALPVRDFSFELAIAGDRGFDYAAGVLPAAEVAESAEETVLTWRYDSLESGVSVGAILPAEEAWDAVLLQMLRHGLAAFLLFFASLIALFERFSVKPRFFQMYLLAAGWAFFYVLLPYLAALVHFYAAWLLSAALVGALLTRFLVALTERRAAPWVAALLAASLVIPTLAVVLRGYTGLIYTLEILVLLAVLMNRATRPEIAEAVDRLLDPPAPPLTSSPSTENSHA
ncbi:MAG: hypothetical protein AAF725_19825 [Acidobacteriota bacterium]